MKDATRALFAVSGLALALATACAAIVGVSDVPNPIEGGTDGDGTMASDGSGSSGSGSGRSSSGGLSSGSGGAQGADAGNGSGGGDAGADVRGVDLGTPDAGSDATAGVDSGVDTGVGSGCVSLTVKNYLSWCSVSVAGATTSTAAQQTVCVAPGAVGLSATAVSGFILGLWHGTAGDTGSGDPGTVTNGTSTTTVAVTSGSACAWICCPFTNGTGCTGLPNQCP